MKNRNKSQDKVEDTPSLAMTPMIDITFLLLIFFMLACKFRTIEGKLKAFLPKGQGQYKKINISQAGKLQVRGI